MVNTDITEEVKKHKSDFVISGLLRAHDNYDFQAMIACKCGLKKREEGVQEVVDEEQMEKKVAEK